MDDAASLLLTITNGRDFCSIREIPPLHFNLMSCPPVYQRGVLYKGAEIAEYKKLTSSSIKVLYYAVPISAGGRTRGLGPDLMDCGMDATTV